MRIVLHSAAALPSFCIFFCTRHLQVLTGNGDPVDKATFDVQASCYLCSLILTNQDIPKGFHTWKEAIAAAK